jgi:putative DNA primase/helicase
MTKVGVLAWQIAEKLLAENHFATMNRNGQVYVYRGGVYEEGGEFYIKKLVQQNVRGEEVSGHLVNEVVGHIQRSTYVKVDVFFEGGPLLVTENGLLDTTTLKLGPHTPEFYSLSKVPVVFDPTKAGQAFAKFLSEVLYAEDIPVVQEWMGYCLHRGYPAQLAILFVGEGNNGKSTLISVLKALLGQDNISAVSLQELETNRFAKADLFGKLANLFADLPDSALKGAGTFKMLTGGDRSGVRRSSCRASSS